MVKVSFLYVWNNLQFMSEIKEESDSDSGESAEFSDDSVHEYSEAMASSKYDMSATNLI